MNLLNLIRRKESRELEVLRKLCERPQNWEFGHYTARHKSGLEIWIANGASFLEEHTCSSQPFRPNYADKHRCYRLLKECALRQLEMSIETKGTNYE